MPKRIQRKRAKGWRMPEGAVYVGRPTKWGNPFVFGEDVPRFARHYLVSPVDPNRKALLRSLYSMSTVRCRTTQQAVDAYGWWLLEQPRLMVALRSLAGRDLVCWCPLDQPCHADVLLEVANA